MKPTQIQSYEGYSYSQGTSNAATQPEVFNPVCQTIRLVLTPSSKQLGSSKIHGEPDKIHSYTFELISFIQQPNHLTNVIIFGTLLQSTTASMTTSQSLVYNTFAWSICLLHYQVASATEPLSKFPMFDCGSAQISQPLVQQYSLNTPDHCSNLSTVYFPPLPHQSIQILQIPNHTPILVHNCLIQIRTKVGYCGNLGFSHMAHAMRTLESKVLFPSSLECIHAVTKGEMQFTVPAFGSAQPSRLTIPLTQGQANFEEYLKGYSTIASDCKGGAIYCSRQNICRKGYCKGRRQNNCDD